MGDGANTGVSPNDGKKVIKNVGRRRTTPVGIGTLIATKGKRIASMASDTALS